jgi:hypothetical protein
MKSESAPRAFARALRRGTLLVSLASLVAVPAAGAATYPIEGGNGFASNAEGWAGVTAECNALLVGSSCQTQNVHSGTQGNPAGSLESTTSVLVNAGGFFVSRATWRSPSFKATAEGRGTLEYDRHQTTVGLANLAPVTTVESVLVNRKTGKVKSLDSENLITTDTEFASHTTPIERATLQAGDPYYLELRSTTTTNTAQAGLLGSISVRFDNVALEVANVGPGGASGSDGVKFTAPPVSNRKLKRLVNRTRWFAATGNLPGGSVVARKDCTIVGTPKADRIKGSRGNDVICGLGGNDVIKGRGGRDLIDGGAGNDRLSGGAKRDTLAALAGKDRLRGGSGADRLGAGKVGDRVSGKGGGDRLVGSKGNDRLAGGAGKDRVSGGSGTDRVIGGKRDRLRSIERGR